MEDPLWCAFCEDRPALGRMIIVGEGTQDILGDLPPETGAACDNCGRNYSGAEVGKNKETGRVGVLQYEHDDFSKITEEDIVRFLAAQKCVVCEDTWEIERWAAERILRQSPSSILDEGQVTWTAVCERCAALGLCPCCQEDDDYES